MAVGIQVFIGINSTLRATEPAHSDPRTVAPTWDECLAKITELKLKHYVPAARTLILKGTMRDR